MFLNYKNSLYYVKYRKYKGKLNYIYHKLMALKNACICKFLYSYIPQSLKALEKTLYMISFLNFLKLKKVPLYIHHSKTSCYFHPQKNLRGMEISIIQNMHCNIFLCLIYHEICIIRVYFNIF
ncbi:hypothetical protein H311_03293 [Anncaliia algerae PRA109]|nr:hypothetical protein H311_03293 [Anncaliia algerae PRA109]